MNGAVRRFAEVVLIAAVLGGVAVGVSRYIRPIRVAGGSMRPALCPGDLVVVAKRPSARAGQIVLLDSPRHGLVLHRVVRVQPDGSVRTRGDANAVEDFDALAATAVVGPVVAVVPVGALLERWRGSAACDTMTAQ